MPCLLRMMTSVNMNGKAKRINLSQPLRSRSSNSLTAQSTKDRSQNVSSPSCSSFVDSFKNLRVTDRARSARPRISIRTSSSSSANNGDHSLDEIASYIAHNKVRNVVVMAGAGISTASGIPDFRTPGTGLYDNLKHYNIPYPEAIFDLDYFHYNPNPFFTLAKELYPAERYHPNDVHYFCRLLHNRGMLLRMYTQNIDGLERIAGIPPDKLVEAHGTFSTATCVGCRKKYDGDEIKKEILSGKLPLCRKTSSCSSIVKPDIVFFGEDLPPKFRYYLKDFPQADLLIVMGTSLEVQPFAGIVDYVRFSVPRILFNLTAVGPFKKHRRMNDITIQGDLVTNIRRFVSALGWQKDLLELSNGMKCSDKSERADSVTDIRCEKNESPVATNFSQNSSRQRGSFVVQKTNAIQERLASKHGSMGALSPPKPAPADAQHKPTVQKPSAQKPQAQQKVNAYKATLSQLKAYRNPSTGFTSDSESSPVISSDDSSDSDSD